MSTPAGRRRETSRHRSASRYLPPEEFRRRARPLTPVLSLLPALAATVLVQWLSPAAQRLPSGSARFDLAAAWLASQPGALPGSDAWITAPPIGHAQLGLLLRVLLAGGADTVLGAAHAAMLLLAALQVALLWSVLRALGAGGLGAGLGAAVSGAAPIAVAAHAEPSVGAVGVVWLLAGAALVLRARRAPAAAIGGAAAAVAVASTPLLLVPIAVLAAAVVVTGRIAARRASAPPDPRPLPASVAFGVVLAVAVVASALLAAGPASPAGRELEAVDAAARLDPRIGAAALARWLQVDPLLLVVATIAVVLAARVAVGRGPAIAAVVLVLLAVWPLGRDPVLPLVLLLPAVAVAIGLSVDLGVAALGHPVFARSAVGSGWLTAVGAVLVVAAGAWLTGLADLVPARSQPIDRVGAWLRTSVPAGQTVLVGLAAWPDLHRSSRAEVGWYADTPVASGEPTSVPWSGTDYVVTDASLAAPRARAAQTALGRSFRVARFGSGAAAMEVRAVRPASTPAPTAPPLTDAQRQARAERARAGAQLAENPRIELSDAGRAQLLAGEVDSRVALVLAQFATGHRIAVSAFGVAPGDRSGVRTAVVISAVDGRSVPGDAAAAGSLLRFLSQLRDEFAARSIDATRGGVSATFAPDPVSTPAT